MEITHYSFGRIVIGSREYHSDILIRTAGTINDAWWRVKGHELQIEDVRELLNDRPAALVVGTGASGMMKVSGSLLKKLQELKIAYHIHPTAQAVEVYNELRRQGVSVAACFHLTC